VVVDGTVDTRGEATWFDTLAAAAAADEVGLEEPPLRVEEPRAGTEETAAAEELGEGEGEDVAGVLLLTISTLSRFGCRMI